MDPNATLKEIRAILAESNRTGKLPDEDKTERLLELVETLDQWLCRGGFLPQAWTQ